MSKLGILSGSTDGEPILIDTTATPGTLIHTAVTGVAQIDEPDVKARNIHTDPVDLTVELGVATTTKLMKVTIPADSGDFQILKNTGIQNGKILRIFASVANVVSIVGGNIRSDIVETY